MSSRHDRNNKDSIKVLHIDDKACFLQTLKFEILGLSSRIDITGATSGKAGLAEIDAGKRYHVIIIDYMLPDMTGPQFLQSLKHRGLTKVAIGLTAHDSRLEEMCQSCALAAYSKTKLDEFLGFFENHIRALDERHLPPTGRLAERETEKLFISKEEV